MAKIKDHTTTIEDDGSITLEFGSDSGLELPPQSMSDAAIDAANEADDNTPGILKAFRYRPTLSTSLILARASNASDLPLQDIVTIALIVFQNTTQPEVNDALRSLMAEKAQILFNSLK